MDAGLETPGRRALPSHQQLVVRTAQPAQDMAHLRRWWGSSWRACNWRPLPITCACASQDSAPWVGASRSFLPEDNGARRKACTNLLSA
jgi:protein ImuB